MTPTIVRVVACLLALGAAPGRAAGASEGKWTPWHLSQLDPAALREQGLEVPVARLWDAERGTGLLSAVVWVAGCSAAFVSAEGLVMTNHHCLFPIVQEHATAERDLITHGFLAGPRGEELPSKTTRITVPRRFTDVGARIEEAAQGATDGAGRTKAIEARKKELVADCERTPDAECKVATFDGGLEYVLIETFELKDVRLVYAPPRAVGEYGGEVDNWTWPRHTGDFAIGRAYVAPDGRAAAYDAANVPYKPEFFLPVSTHGVAPGDFVMVPGYPGVTYRSLIGEEMAERRDRYFPRREEVFGEWIKILETTTANSPEGAIAVAADLKTLQNRYKNAQGQVAGFRRGRILEKQQAADDAVAAWAAGQPNQREALEARRGLRTVLEEQRGTWERDFLLSLIPLGVRTSPGMGPRLPKALHHAVTIAHLARERARPAAEQEPDFTEKDVARIRDRGEREQKSTFLPADQAVFLAFVERSRRLPEAQRVVALESAFGRHRGGPGPLRAAVQDLYSRTKVTSVEERSRMLGETEGQLRSRQDPLLELGFALDADIREMRQRQAAWEGRISLLRPRWRRATIAHAGRPVAPDANSTLRVSFAQVQGYSPRDAVVYKAQTTLGGALEKHRGQEPFDLPQKVRAAAPAAPGSRWSDRRLRDVPIGFLADADTTGGNSGSPVLNARGELVGLNFDRVWENVANDFGFDPEVARNVSVDVRYLLWMLDEVEKADALLRELGVR